MSLISLLIFVIVLGLVFYILRLLPLPEPWRTVAFVILALIAIVYLLRLIGVTVPAKAHDVFDRECCGNGDCFWLPVDAVEELGAQGWRVRYRHPKFGEIDTIVPPGKKRHSTTGKFGFCAMNDGEAVVARCFYAPSNA
jgi:hypothetical protein